MVQRCIVLTEDEWRQLPIQIANNLYAESLKKSGFTVTLKESGLPIIDRFGDWLVGTTVRAFEDAVSKPAKQLESLESYNKRKQALHSQILEVGNGIACPKCGNEMRDNNAMVVKTSNPPVTGVYCPECGACATRIA